MCTGETLRGKGGALHLADKIAKIIAIIFFFFFFNLTIFPTPLWVPSPFLPNVALYSVRLTASPVGWAYSHGCPYDPLQTVKG